MVDPNSIAEFKRIRRHLARLEAVVWRAILDLGPTHDLRLQEYLEQAESLKRKKYRRQWPINVVTGRRYKLALKGHIIFSGYYRCVWNGKTKVRKFWALSADKREPAGCEKLTPEEVEAMKSNTRIQNSVASRQNMTPSDFGRALVNFRYEKAKHQPINTNQRMLFA